MPLQNRNQHEPGRFRVQITCPNCGTVCIVRTSTAITNKLRESNLQCVNVLCGWTGVAHTEIVRTINPPPKHNTHAALPPPVDADFFERKHDEKSLF